MDLFALTTTQGTAAPETALCEDDVKVVAPLQAVFVQVELTIDDIDLDETSFVNVTDNEAIRGCTWCGRGRDGRIA